jgi:hypothetical protein
LSNADIESEYEEDELYDEDDIAISSKSTHSEEDIAFTKAFMNLDLDALDKVDACLSTCIRDLFHVASKIDAPATYIKDKDYEFTIDSELIERVEASKLYGKEEEFPSEYLITNLNDLSCLYGKTEIQQRYYFLKLIHFSLGGKSKSWYNSLAPKSITSKEACIYLFCNRYFHSSKIHAMIAEISNFAQSKEECIPQAWGRYCALEKRFPIDARK